MRLCIVGIGGCGGKVAEKFLQNRDISIFGGNHGSYICLDDVQGMWLEADVQETKGQTFFKQLDSLKNGYQPFYYIPHDILSSESETAKLVQDKYGYDLKKQGFFRQAEFLKAVFEIFDTDKQVRDKANEEYHYDNPILRNTWNIIRPYTTVAEASENGNGANLCDGILFIISLGGGTGTGFINPITGYIREERNAYPIFVLGVLTEEGEDKQQGAIEEKRDLGAVISLYDLLTKRVNLGIDGMILVDNQILMEKFKGNYDAINSYIYQFMRPMIDRRHYPMENPPSLAVREQFIESLEMPPILVPCYCIEKGKECSVEDLIKRALNNGKLFWCDPKKADKVYVFTRGFLDSEVVKKVLIAQTGLNGRDIQVWRKIGDGHSNEVLALLRNPYGSSENQFIKGTNQFIKGTFENRIYRLVYNANNYIEEHKKEEQKSGLIQPGLPERTNEALEHYFFGEKDGLQTKLKGVLTKIENGDRPIFLDEKNIFGVLKTQDQTQMDETTIPEKQLTSIESRILAIENVLKEKGLVEDKNQPS